MAQHPTKNIIILIMLAVAFMAGTIAAASLESGHTLVGLGQHEETGRKIYLGGIYLPEGTSRPGNLLQLSSPVSMEYRIVARRTSIRSLLGGMLLQSEVATGRAPSKATTLFADMILSNVKTSLYAGDSLVIEAIKAGETLAFLNGHQLARVEDLEVANYLLLGWISENGPTALFRSEIMAEDVDQQMLSILAATRYTARREAQVAASFTPAQPEPAAPNPAASSTESIAETAQNQPSALEPVSSTTPATAIVDEQTAAVDEPVTLATSAATTATAALATTTGAYPPEGGFDNFPHDSAAVTDDAGVETAAQSPLEIPAEIQTASLIPIALVPQQHDEVLALGVQEYSRRLSEFHGNLVTMVYREIRYPKRAVRRSLEGRLELDLTLQNNGELVAVMVSQSSGHKLLDNAAVKAAKKAFNSGALTSIDAVAIAEFGSYDDNMVIPIPVNFKLAQ